VATTERGWDSKLSVTKEMVEELSLCRTHMHEFNTMPLFLEQAVVEIIRPHQTRYVLNDMDPRDLVKPRDVFISGKRVFQ
jgi:hypothetical protein